MIWEQKLPWPEFWNVLKVFWIVLEFPGLFWIVLECSGLFQNVPLLILKNVLPKNINVEYYYYFTLLKICIFHFHYCILYMSSKNIFKLKNNIF